MDGRLGFLYRDCLRTGELGTATTATTWDAVFRGCDYVALFFAAHSAQCGAVAAQLRALCDALNGVSPQLRRRGSASSPARIRKFFGASKSKSLNGAGKFKDPNAKKKLGVIVVSLDADSESFCRTLEATSGWPFLPPQQTQNKIRLVRCLSVDKSPTLVMVEAATGAVVSRDARRSLADDPSAAAFPWYPAKPHEILAGSLIQTVDGATKQVLFDDVKKKYTGLFFGANWVYGSFIGVLDVSNWNDVECPPCRSFLPTLKTAYAALRGRGVDFELIFCSSDRSADSFAAFREGTDWAAFPFGDPRVKALTRTFDVHGIPSLLILDEENRLLTRYGTAELKADPEGEAFPWTSRNLVELTEWTTPRLKEELVCVLFTEGLPEDVEFARGLLSPIADAEAQACTEAWTREGDANGNPIVAARDPLQFFFSGPDEASSEALLESLGLGEAELPLLVVLDAVAGSFAVCEDPAVSTDVTVAFLADYRAGRLRSAWLPHPPPAAATHLGGIPMAAISTALTMSPSQNSMVASVAATADSSSQGSPPASTNGNYSPITATF